VIDVNENERHNDTPGTVAHLTHLVMTLQCARAALRDDRLDLLATWITQDGRCDNGSLDIFFAMASRDLKQCP